MEQKYFICGQCGNIVALVRDAGVPVACCGQKMARLIPGTIEASTEKHIPVCQREGNAIHVRVGAADHPMIPEHHIEWISLQTSQGGQWKALRPGEDPAACFALCEGDQLEAVYAYCNLHGLWRG